LGEPTASPGSVRDRLVVALADPEVARPAGRTSAALIAFQDPMAIFEWPGAGKGLVLLDHGRIPDGELRGLLDRILAAHEKGVLFIAVAGGGAEVAETLRAVAAQSPRVRLGLYHTDEAGQTHQVAGRRLPELEQAGRNLPETEPLSAEAVAAIAERGRQQKLEALEFLQSSARRFPQVTIAVIAICFLLFVATSSQDVQARWLFDTLCNRPDGVRHGELWRLFTYALLHDTRNPVYLLVNMLSLYSLGGFLEPMLGRRRLALLYGVTAVAGGLASTLFARAVSVGAAGLAWGLLGATLGVIGGKQRLLPALLVRGLRLRLLVNLCLLIAVSFLPHVDVYCYAGAVAGFLLARYYTRGRKP
jgi:membrane associated rhomboid family serine protease